MAKFIFTSLGRDEERLRPGHVDHTAGDEGLARPRDRRILREPSDGGSTKSRLGLQDFSYRMAGSPASWDRRQSGDPSDRGEDDGNQPPRGRLAGTATLIRDGEEAKASRDADKGSREGGKDLRQRQPGGELAGLDAEGSGDRGVVPRVLHCRSRNEHGVHCGQGGQHDRDDQAALDPLAWSSTRIPRRTG